MVTSSPRIFAKNFLFVAAPLWFPNSKYSFTSFARIDVLRFERDYSIHDVRIRFSLVYNGCRWNNVRSVA